jgi:HSP20 family protein
MNATECEVRETSETERFHLCRPEEIGDPMRMHEAIGRRAYHLFQTRGCKPGHQREDWVKAESELLRPIAVEIEERPEEIVVRANVGDFEEAELQASVEPWRLMIAGRKKEKWEFFYFDWQPPDQIFRAVSLPQEVVPELAVATLHSGTLEISLRRKRMNRDQGKAQERLNLQASYARVRATKAVSR